VIGVHDELKGQVPIVFATLKSGTADANAKHDAANGMQQRVVEMLGGVAKPARVYIVNSLPKRGPQNYSGARCGHWPKAATPATCVDARRSERTRGNPRSAQARPRNRLTSARLVAVPAWPRARRPAFAGSRKPTATHFPPIVACRSARRRVQSTLGMLADDRPVKHVGLSCRDG